MQTSLRIAMLAVLLVASAPGPAAAANSISADAAATASSQPAQRAAQDEFVPISQLPPDERLPAAPLLVAAYAVVWTVLMWYLWSIWRRLGRLERDLAAAVKRHGTHGSAPPR